MRIVKDRNRNYRPGYRDLVFQTACGLHNYRWTPNDEVAVYCNANATYRPPDFVLSLPPPQAITTYCLPLTA